MKTTKILFSMVCTAALFAACSSEEFEQEGSATLNRKTLNVTLTAENVAGANAETRLGAEIAGGKMTYKWTEDDRLGAALLDGSVMSTYEAANAVSVNYPFDFTTGAEDAANFSAKTPIMQGTYMFYYQYKPQTTRGPLTLAVEAQQNYVASEGTPENQMAKYYVGVSPRLTLADGIAMEGDASGLTLPLKFQKLNAAIKLAVTPKDLPAGTKINKIELKSAGAIVLGGEYQIPGGTVVTAAPGQNAIAVKNNNYLADDIEEAAADIVPTAVTDGSVTSNTIAVSMYADADKKAAGERGIELTNGTAFNAYIVVPVTAAAADYKVAIYTSEGKLEYTVEDIKFEVNKVYASAFAFELKKADMNKYESFDVASTADWDEAINYVNSHTAEYLGEPVNFNIYKGEIYVASLPTFPITLTSQDAAATMILGKKNKATTTINIDKNITVDNDDLGFVIGKGATVNYNNAITTTQTVTFENKGTFNVAANATQAITNKGTMTMRVAQTAANIINAKDASLTFKGGSKNITYKATTLKNNGNITVEQKAILDAPLSTAAFGTYDPVAVITVNGEWKNAAAGVDNLAKTKVVVASTGVLNMKSNAVNGTIEVSGLLRAVAGATNNGTITIKTGAKGNATAITNDGKIVIEDYTGYSANQDSSTAKFMITNNPGGITTVNVSSKSQYDGVTTDGNINDITLNGGSWTIGGGSSAAISVAGGNGLTLKNATVTLGADQNIGNSLKISGTSSISGAFTLAATKLNIEENASLTVAKNTTVTVVGTAAADGAVIEVDILGSLTNNGTLKGATGKEFIDIKVGKAVTSGKHAASLTNGSTGTIAETGKAATVKNYGTVTLHQNGNAYVTVNNQTNAVLNGNPK